MPHIRIILPGAVLALLPVLGTAQPSFDCDAARTATERAICAAPDLARLESQMVEVYRDLVGRIGEAEAREIADMQLERRQACEGDQACIERQLLTSIGIFRAEISAASTPELGREGEAALEDLRTSLGNQETATETAPARADARDARRARALAEGFERLPEHRRRNVQGRLREAGFLDGPVDGIWGESSAAAVQALLDAARGQGRTFRVGRAAGADALYRFIDSDPFYYEFIAGAAR